MKKAFSGRRSAASLVLALLLCAGVALADGLGAFREVTKTNADAAVPVRLVATRGQYFRSATIYGRLSARVNNSSSVWLGINSTNNTQPIEVTAGGSVVISAPVNSFLDLYDIYLDVVTAGDGVVVVWDPAP